MEDERTSDTEETFGEENPPQGVSNQNSEEADAPSEAGGRDRGGSDSGDSGNPGGSGGTGGEGSATEGSRDDNPGGAGEHSQATGNPDAAG